LTAFRRLAAVIAMALGFGAGPLAAADRDFSACPWIVQPDEPLVGLGADIATYEILFTGRTTKAIFYGFTVAAHDLARQLTDEGEIPDLMEDGRSLETVERDGATVYRVSSESILPRTIYLLAAAMPMKQLERIDARIDPARPIAVGLRTRGATDLSGPMPRRTVPGVEILASAAHPEEATEPPLLAALEPDFQLCAYQVSWN
jgi:hypothetical protein